MKTKFKTLSAIAISSTLAIYMSCGSEESETATAASETTSCVITSIEKEGTAEERDVSGCWELVTPSTSTDTIEADCKSGELGGTAGTFAKTACPSIETGIYGCKDFKTKYGGTGTIWYTGEVWQQEGADASIKTQCDSIKGTVGQKA